MATIDGEGSLSSRASVKKKKAPAVSNQFANSKKRRSNLSARIVTSPRQLSCGICAQRFEGRIGDGVKYVSILSPSSLSRSFLKLASQVAFCEKRAVINRALEPDGSGIPPRLRENSCVRAEHDPRQTGLGQQLHIAQLSTSSILGVSRKKQLRSLHFIRNIAPWNFSMSVFRDVVCPSGIPTSSASTPQEVVLDSGIRECVV